MLCRSGAIDYRYTCGWRDDLQSNEHLFASIKRPLFACFLATPKEQARPGENSKNSDIMLLLGTNNMRRVPRYLVVSFI